LIDVFLHKQQKKYFSPRFSNKSSAAFSQFSCTSEGQSHTFVYKKSALVKRIYHVIAKKTPLFLAYSLAAMLFYSPAILASKKWNNIHALESEGQILLASYNDQKNQPSLPAEIIADILTAADSIKAITESSTADNFRTLWPTTGNNAFTKILADNDIATLQDFKAKILTPYRLNTRIQDWITKFNKSIFTPKSREFKALAHSLTQAVMQTSKEEEQAVVNLYSIFFRAYAVRTFDALPKATHTSEITKNLTGRRIEDLFKRFKIKPEAKQTNLAEKHSSIFAEPIVHDLNITDPETANSILVPLYASHPIEDLQSISRELESIAGKHQKLLKKADLEAMHIALNAQQLNNIIQLPTTYMNEALANVSQGILEQLLHGITLMNNTINNVSQNVGPYKKASDKLATTAESSLKALVDTKETLDDLIKKLSEDSKSIQHANSQIHKSAENPLSNRTTTLTETSLEPKPNTTLTTQNPTVLKPALTPISPNTTPTESSTSINTGTAASYSPGTFAVRQPASSATFPSSYNPAAPTGGSSSSPTSFAPTLPTLNTSSETTPQPTTSKQDTNAPSQNPFSTTTSVAPTPNSSAGGI